MNKEMIGFMRNALLGNISSEPLCEEYKAAWRACGDDKEKLVKLAMRQQSIPYVCHACHENLGLSKQYILDNFGDYINGKTLFDADGVDGYSYQLYVGFKDDFVASADVTSLMWCSSPLIQIDACKCPLFYISNDSDVRFALDGYNSIRIYLFDDSKVTIEDADESCDVLIYKYNSRAEVELGKFCLCKVKVFDKTIRL